MFECNEERSATAVVLCAIPLRCLCLNAMKSGVQRLVDMPPLKDACLNAMKSGVQLKSPVPTGFSTYERLNAMKSGVFFLNVGN